MPAEVQQNGDRVVKHAAEIFDWIGEIAEVGESLGRLIRHHGDYHLGQVVLTKANDFILLDFEGEPMRPLEERRGKGSALKDIAGMIRSFHYAAETALAAAEAATAQSIEKEKLRPWSRAWYEWVSSAFVGAYMETAAGAPFLPTGDAGIVLDVYLLEKAFYELKYEMNNRPAWIHIPLAGIIDIIDRRNRGENENIPVIYYTI